MPELIKIIFIIGNILLWSFGIGEELSQYHGDNMKTYVVSHNMY